MIATKVFNPMSDDVNDRGLSRKHILDSIDRSLKRLQMDYVDLYQIHRWDYDTPIEETMEALHDVVQAGKARYIGASSMFAWQFTKAQYTADLHGWTRFVSMQNHYNLIYREEEREMIPCCIDQGVALIPWSPMARGFFAGNHRKGDWGETTRARTDAYAQSCTTATRTSRLPTACRRLRRQRGVTGSQIALAWVLSKPYVTAPIIGASRMEHLDQAIAALRSSSRRRKQAPRRALPAASGPRALMSRDASPNEPSLCNLQAAAAFVGQRCPASIRRVRLTSFRGRRSHASPHLFALQSLSFLRAPVDSGRARHDDPGRARSCSYGKPTWTAGSCPAAASSAARRSSRPPGGKRAKRSARSCMTSACWVPTPTFNEWKSDHNILFLSEDFNLERQP